MCAISEIVASGFQGENRDLEQNLQDFNASKRQVDSTLSLTLSQFKGNCFCETSREFSEALCSLLTFLAEHSESVLYSPNDYSEDPSESRSLKAEPSLICRSYLPSLESPPMRIRVKRPMITIYYWEDDDKAADLIDELRKRGLQYQAELLDAENPNASPSVEYQGKMYSDFRKFLKVLD